MAKSEFPIDKIGGTQEIIFMFRDNERWLSNFWPCKVALPAENIMIGSKEIELPAMEFNSTELAYVARKTLDLNIRKKIQNMSSGDAKEFSQQEDFPMRDNYESSHKLAIMNELVRQKYSDRNPELKEKLIATGNTTIIEGNTWGDTFFGLCLETGVGENWLGRITMQVRNELMPPIL